MQDGSKMIKLDVNRKGHRKKTFVLDEDMTGIRYTPSKKKCKCRLTGTEFVLGDKLEGMKNYDGSCKDRDTNE